MSNIKNIFCYYKCLDIYKKTYRQRGAWARHFKKGLGRLFYARYGEHHFPSDLK